ncbi:uncharacterized protein E5676_scaffold105G00150 [Cucumis melo var. makuwa]|uniref:Putative plant transposon protein domain-containing protein n=1 Tax=Cucumis melo var. makuwa TaxID=1194695 RepID=A0A5A7U3M8_CUCMM|nr:uncharacterized protein E6C27_scaffold13G00270 [Cucumis melo var. makuwa]TYK07618.1 uncharacterized protein E5676_scaffold105G00150 [Cucumis melo var. makuwa]
MDRDIPDLVSDVGEDRPQKKSRKASARPKVITTKIRCRKVPPNIPSILIDGILFHLEESAQRWKYAAKRSIVADVNISDKHHSCLLVMDLVIQADLSKTISNVGPFYPQLIKEFIVNLPSEFNDPSRLDYQTAHIRGSMFKISPAIINGTVSVWPINGIPAVSLSVKYVILYKVGIANWFPSSHASSVSVALGTFLYQICNDESVDVGLFIYNQLLRHVDIFRVKIPIPLPMFFSRSHVPIIEHDMRPSRNARVFDSEDVNFSSEAFNLPQELASHVINTLTAESQTLYLDKSTF